MPIGILRMTDTHTDIEHEDESLPVANAATSFFVLMTLAIDAGLTDHQRTHYENVRTYLQDMLCEAVINGFMCPHELWVHAEEFGSLDIRFDQQGDANG
jgi:hypothetical protein